MSRKFLADIDLAKNSLNNARVQNLASDPSSPVTGQVYYNTGTNKFRIFNGTSWDEMGSGTATGDFSSNTSTSVDNEVVLFNGTTGKSGKRATGTGYAKLTAGVLSTQSSPIPVSDGGTGSATRNFVDLSSTESIGGVKTFSNSPVVPDPTTATQAASKNYVDLAVQGINWKASVRVATTSNGTLASAFANGSTVDGVTLSTGDRILIKNQTSGSDNGIYVVAASGAPSRASDADTGSEIQQAAVFVREGTSNADSAWVNTNDGSITLGTTSLTFVQFSQSGGVQAATTTTAGITRYATGSETNAKSVTNAAVTPSGLTSYTQKYSATIGDGSTTAIAVTHNLGTKDVVSLIRDASTDLVVECDITNTSTSVTTFTFNTAPATNAYRVVIVG